MHTIYVDCAVGHHAHSFGGDWQSWNQMNEPRGHDLFDTPCIESSRCDRGLSAKAGVVVANSNADADDGWNLSR